MKINCHDCGGPAAYGNTGHIICAACGQSVRGLTRWNQVQVRLRARARLDLLTAQLRGGRPADPTAIENLLTALFGDVHESPTI
ncbi:MAG: hypothetical protein DRQ48_00320 [Gammaproteobacteria bacterium]|nr:MAG: hypothetical protein DRQ48_00320 [Gammaproteobacteria bacterium]